MSTNGHRSLPPHNLHAEASLIGAMLLERDVAAIGLERLTADDFYKQAHGHIFYAIGQLVAEATPVDPVTVGDELNRTGLLDAVGGMPALLGLQGNAGFTGNVPAYSKIVSDYSLLRRLIAVAGEIAETSYDIPEDVAKAIDHAEDLLTRVSDRQLVEIPAGFETLDEFLDRAEGLGEDFAPWLIPGLMKRGWRVLTVGSPGSGKSTLLQEVAIVAAGGMHPFTHRPLDRPVRALVVDLENPEERIEQTARPLRDGVRREGKWERDNCFYWKRPEGLDLTQRKDRAELEATIRKAKPDLVAIGPLYKSAPLDGVNASEVAAKVMALFDRLRTKYQFGLLMEHHPPHGDGPLRAKGSTQWQNWPEIGIALTEVEAMGGPRAFELKRFRGDRVKAEWPEAVRHSRGSVDGWRAWIVERGAGEQEF